MGFRSNRSVTDDPERRGRFEREARAVAALNHPNIITIYSVEEQDTVLFLTMELVEGKTLAELLPRQGRRCRDSTLVIHSRDDLAVSADEGRLLASLIPGAQLVLLPSGTHYFPTSTEVVTKTAGAIDRFLHGSRSDLNGVWQRLVGSSSDPSTNQQGSARDKQQD